MAELVMARLEPGCRHARYFFSRVMLVKLVMFISIDDIEPDIQCGVNRGMLCAEPLYPSPETVLRCRRAIQCPRGDDRPDGALAASTLRARAASRRHLS